MVIRRPLAPLAPYLAAWPGTLVVVCVPDPDQHARTVPAAIADRLLVHRSIESGLQEARTLMPPMEQTQTFLAPVPLAVPAARAFVRHALHDWQLTDLAWPGESGGQRAGDQRTATLHHRAEPNPESRAHPASVAVHGHGGGAPSIPTRSAAEAATQQDGRGLELIDAETRTWGVFPTRGSGKTVWALLDAA